MYKFIFNPMSNRKVFTNSSLGREIIRKYNYNLQGGNNEIFSSSESDDEVICDEERCIDQFVDLLENNNINHDAETYDQLGIFSDLNDEEINLVREEIDKILARDDEKLLREYYFDKVRDKLISFTNNSDCMDNQCIFRIPTREQGNNLDDLIINQFAFLNPELGNASIDQSSEYSSSEDNDNENSEYDSDDDSDNDSGNDRYNSDDSEDDDDNEDDEDDEDDDDSEDDEDDDDSEDDEDDDSEEENGYLSDAPTLIVNTGTRAINIYANDNSELETAVNMYCTDQLNAIETYGELEEWEVINHEYNRDSDDFFQGIINDISDISSDEESTDDYDNISDDQEDRIIVGEGFRILRGREHLLEEDVIFAKWEYDDQTGKLMLMGLNTETDEWFQLNFREIEPEGEILIDPQLLDSLSYGHIPSPSQVN